MTVSYNYLTTLIAILALGIGIASVPLPLELLQAEGASVDSPVEVLKQM